MPIKSKAQRRWLHWAESQGKLPKGTAKRWEDHTPDKPLPERVTATDSDAEKKAFVAEFLLKCAANGVIDTYDVADMAEQLLSTLEKQASVGNVVGQGVGTVAGAATALPLLGSIALPLVGGFAGGSIAGKTKNQIDSDDVDVLRLQAEANAYKRRAQAARMHGQIRKLLASNPNKYVVIG